MNSDKALLGGGQPSNPSNAQRPPHLTAEQMEAMLRRSPYRKQVGKHLDTCASCREEVEHLSELLHRFRATSMVYAERKRTGCGADEAIKPPRQLAAALGPWRWSMAACALACVLAVSPWVHFRAPVKEASVPAQRDLNQARATAELSDEALLAGVQDDLASTVPVPLQPLAATQASTSGVIRFADESTGSRKVIVP